MINFDMTPSQQAEFVMPISGSGLVDAVRALPTPVTSGVVSAAAAGSKPWVDTTVVCGYRHITDVAVATGAFPGISAWSPPI
jgi:hypothetical protein